MKRRLLNLVLSCLPYGSKAFWAVFPHAWLAEDAAAAPSRKKARA